MRLTGFFARVYALAIFLLVSVLVALMVFLEFQVEGNDEEDTLALARWIGEDIYRDQNDGNIGERVDDLSEKLKVEVAIFAVDGTLIFATSGSQLSPATSEQLARLAAEREMLISNERVLVGMFEGEHMVAYILTADVSSIDISIGWRGVLIVLAVLAVLSWFLARRFARPLERLAANVEAFGAGDFSVRMNSRRSDEIGDVSRRFDAMADQVAALMRQERELLASVSHEFRTPLQRLRFFLEILESRGVIDAKEAAAVAADISELDQLIGDIMLAARLDRGRDGGEGTDRALLSLKEQDVAAVTAEVCERFRGLYPSRTVVEAPADSAIARIDHRLFARAISNLLDNANKYSPEAEPIEVVLETSADEVTVSVLDRGVAVPASERDRIFEAFEQGDSSRAGVGLGLALVRRIANLHEGRVGVVAREGGGSCFRLAVPREAGAPEKPAPRLGSVRAASFWGA